MEFYKEKQDQTVLEKGVRVWRQDTAPNGIAVNAHVHENIEFLYVTHGGFYACINDKTYTLYPGDLILIRSNAVHSITAMDFPKNTYYVVKIRPSILFDLAPPTTGGEYVLHFTLIPASDISVFHKSNPEDAAVMQALDNLIKLPTREEYGKDLAGKIYAASFLLEILCRWNRASGEEESELSDIDGNLARQIYRAVSYINMRYAEDITASVVASAIHMSYSYFSRSFSRIVGKSFKEYLNEVRLSHAESILLTTDKSVTEVASLCGYDNVSYFISLYKQKKGLTPFAHREKIESGVTPEKQPAVTGAAREKTPVSQDERYAVPDSCYAVPDSCFGGGK